MMIPPKLPQWQLLLTATFLAASSVVRGALFENIDELLNDGGKVDAFDYVIVGGGLAGSVLANRLSEDGQSTVLVLEAGPSSFGVEELLYGVERSDNKWTWNYTWTPQTGLNGRTFDYKQGRVLGGGSSLNGLVWTRGTAEDYDRLANDLSDSRWSWEEMLPYFIKSEEFVRPLDGHDPSGQYDPSVHGDQGPVKLSVSGYPRDSDSYIEQLIQGRELPFVLDYNSGEPIGAGSLQSNTGGGERHSAAISYLSEEYLSRDNLFVVVNTEVGRILGDFETGAVHGVEVYRGNEEPSIFFNATQEVILSAGSVNSPRLLLLSGIGDATYLEGLNISVLHDLPDVGKNFQDSWELYPTYYLNTTTPDVNIDDPFEFAAAVEQWRTNRTGALSSTWANWIFNLRLDEEDPEVKEVFKKFGDPSSGKKSHHVEIIPVPDFDAEGKPVMSFVITIMYPTSHGSVTLNTTSATAPHFNYKPLVDPAHYTSPSPYDILANKWALKYIHEKIVPSPAWGEYIIGPTDDLAEAFEGGEEGLVEWIRENTLPGLHGVGTSKMTAASESGGVLNSDLKVKGLKGLRVVDCGVLPFIPAAHTQSPVYAIAERAAAIIKDDKSRRA